MGNRGSGGLLNFGKRSLNDDTNAVIPDDNMANLRMIHLPQLLEGYKYDNSPSGNGLIRDPDSFVMTIYSIFMIMKLVSMGHPKSQPIYDEICGNIFPNQQLDECEANLYASFSKFDNVDTKGVSKTDGQKPVANNQIERIFQTLMIEMQNMIKHSKLGEKMEKDVCHHFDKQDKRGECISKFNTMLSDLKKKFKELDDSKIVAR